MGCVWPQWGCAVIGRWAWVAAVVVAAAFSGGAPAYASAPSNETIARTLGVVATVDPVAHTDPATGGITITGTIACTASVVIGYTDGTSTVSEKVGRFEALSSPGFDVWLGRCGPEPSRWAFTAVTGNRLVYRPGVALVEPTPLLVCTVSFGDCVDATGISMPLQVIVRVEPGGALSATPSGAATRPPTRSSAAALAMTAPPPNDNVANATPIRSLPFTHTVATAGATPGVGDLGCIDTYSPHTVWYAFTPSRTERVGISTTLGWAVATGPPGALTTSTCNGSSQTWTAVAGTRYLIELASTDGSPASVVVDRAVRPQVKVSLDHIGVYYHGIVVLTGSVTCNQNMQGFGELVISELMNRLYATSQRGGGPADGCSTTPRRWRVMFESNTLAAFELGRVSVDVQPQGCTLFECTYPPPYTRIVTLRWGRP
jgi:hypothetical protein